MRFLPFVLKNLMRRKARSILTIGGVAVAVGAVVALLGITVGFEQMFGDLYKKRGVAILVVQAGKTDRLSSFIDETLAENMWRPGVKSVTPGLVDFYNYTPPGEGGLVGNPLTVPLQGWDPDSILFQDVRMLSGRRITHDDRRGVMLGMILAKNLDKKVGDIVDVYDNQFEVVGIYESFNLLENSSMVLPIKELQKLIGQEGKVSGFQIGVDDPSDKESIDRIRREIDGLGIGVSAMATDDYIASTSQIRLAHAMTWVTSIIALIIGVIGILNTMVMSVLERTREIGILRAIGWRQSRVMRMILSESLLLSVAGAIVGAAGAWIVVNILSMTPACSGFISGRLEWPVVIKGFLIALAVGLVGGVYPALRAAHLLPTEALRHE
ncbi:MAG: ABC transporter permease [Gemmataceae bacterium]